MAADAIASARIRLQQLQALHAAGRLDDAAYDAERRAVEHELGDLLLQEPAPAVRPRPSKGLLAGLAVAVLMVAIGGYLKTGWPSLLAGGSAATGREPPMAQSADPTASGASTGLQQIAAMVETLAARMKERPDDAEGWVMLARSYTVLGRFPEALPAYRRASELLPQNAALLADWADAVAATRSTANNPESQALIERALKIDPAHPKALALAGTADYERGDYAGAIRRWQAIVARLPPDSELARQVVASIDDAKAKLAGGSASAAVATSAAPMAAALPAPSASTPPSSASPTAVAASPPTPAAAAPAVAGTVSLDPKLAGKVGPDDTVFVFARAANGGRMPLAVQRARAAELPLRFRLDDSMAMAPGMTISGAGQVIVGARISRSGNATPSPGDLAGEAFAPAVPGARNVVVRIDKVVGGP